MASGKEILNQVLVDLKEHNLTGKIVKEDDAIKGSGAHFDVYRGWSTEHNKRVALRRLRIFLEKEPVFLKVSF